MGSGDDDDHGWQGLGKTWLLSIPDASSCAACVCVQIGQLEDPLAFRQPKPGTDHEEPVVAHSHAFSHSRQNRGHEVSKRLQ